jgi:aldose 1-epimerase
MRVKDAGEVATAIGGMEPITLWRNTAPHDRHPEFLDATFLPGRGMNLFQVRARLPGFGTVNLLHSPSAEEARRRMNGGPDDWMGVQSFSCGGAFLVPFANRIRGERSQDGRTIETEILGRRVRLPADWHGSQPGAEHCAIHGLMLRSPMQLSERSPDRVTATLPAGDFDGHWLSRTLVRVDAALRASEIELSVTAQNVGEGPLPVGIGWHPYFAIPSGQRAQCRVHLPARQRAAVNNYDDVFPTGQLEPIDGPPYDFTPAEGAPLGSGYFDDSFVDLQRTANGHTSIDITDPAAGYRMRLTALSPHVEALQLYSRPDQPFVVVEPQFNFADPFSTVWPPRVDTGMVVLRTGAEVTWGVRWELLEV